MQTDTGKDLDVFVQALKDPAYFSQVGPGFALLVPGDWQGLIRWATSLGYTFTLQELHTYCQAHPQILASATPESGLAGWSQENLKQAVNG